MEDVHDHLQVIEHDPLARRETVDRRGANSVILAQAFLDLTGNRAQMRLRCSGTDDEKIRKAGNAAQVENRDVFRLFVVGQFGAASR